MKISQELKSLCENPLAQRRAQAAVEKARDEWLSDRRVMRLMRDLEAYGAGAEWDDCPALGELMTSTGPTNMLIARLVEGLCAVLRENPLAHVPFRHQRSGGTSILQIATPGRAALVLLAYDGTGPDCAIDRVTFSDVERRELVLAGSAELVLSTLQTEWANRAEIASASRRIAKGESLLLLPNEARSASQVHGRMVMLRVARTPADPAPSRVFDIHTGRLLHRASGNRAESHGEMALALLGRMGRLDAVPLFAELAREGSAHFRWQALRECLALDSGAGFTELARIAADPGDPLQSPAASLRAQLLEAHPQLARLESFPCPA